MKRALFVVSLAGSMLLAMTGVAMGYGYKATESTDTAGNTTRYGKTDGYTRAADTPIYTTNPHGNYSSTSNKCKTCHAVHQAGSPGQISVYRLLRDATDVNSSCDYCHVGAGAHTNRLVYGYANGTPTTATNGHTIGAPMNIVPDRASSSRTDTLVCNTCHSVHGAKTIKFATSSTDPTPMPSKILRNDPYGVGPVVADTTTVYGSGSYGLVVSQFCLNCHDMNQGSKSHPLRAPTVGKTPAVAYLTSENCLNCHGANGAPHASNATTTDGTSGYVMLKGKSGDLVNKNQLDDVCVQCHQKTIGTVTTGVGTSF